MQGIVIKCPAWDLRLLMYLRQSGGRFFFFSDTIALELEETVHDELGSIN